MIEAFQDGNPTKDFDMNSNLHMFTVINGLVTYKLKRLVAFRLNIQI